MTAKNIGESVEIERSLNSAKGLISSVCTEGRVEGLKTW